MPDFYFARYLPLLIHILVAGGIACAMVTAVVFHRPAQIQPAKMSPYECGMEPVGDARQRFTVKFYLVAMLFILFDVEAVFLYPWAIVQKHLKAAGLGMFWFWEMLVYIGIVLAGLLVRLEEGRARLEQAGQGGEDLAMALEPAITDIEQLKDRPEVARSARAGMQAPLTGAKFDRNELTIWVDRTCPARCLLGAEERPAAAVQRSGRRHLRGLVSRKIRASKSCTTCFPLPNKKLSAAEGSSSPATTPASIR